MPSSTPSSILNTLVVSLAVTAGLVAVAISLVVSMQLYQANQVTLTKNQAVQACLELARATRQTVTIADGKTATISEPSLNPDIIKLCLQQKGY